MASERPQPLHRFLDKLPQLSPLLKSHNDVDSDFTSHAIQLFVRSPFQFFLLCLAVEAAVGKAVNVAAFHPYDWLALS